MKGIADEPFNRMGKAARVRDAPFGRGILRMSDGTLCHTIGGKSRDSRIEPRRQETIGAVLRSEVAKRRSIGHQHLVDNQYDTITLHYVGDCNLG
jgi:hypothetical protein